MLRHICKHLIKWQRNFLILTVKYKSFKFTVLIFTWTDGSIKIWPPIFDTFTKIIPLKFLDRPMNECFVQVLLNDYYITVEKITQFPSDCLLTGSNRIQSLGKNQLSWQQNVTRCTHSWSQPLPRCLATANIRYQPSEWADIWQKPNEEFHVWTDQLSPCWIPGPQVMIKIKRTVSQT